MVWIKDFGAVCDGSTDDTAAIQNAWNYAASVNLDVWLGGVGPKCKISSLTMPAPIVIGLGSDFGAARTSMLHGPASNQVMLVSTVTGTTCAITITAASYGTNSSLAGKFSSFGVTQVAQNQAGNGICLNNITKATFEDVSISYFATGFNANDTSLLNIEKSWFEHSLVQISGQQVSNTGPNAWNIKNNHFSSSGLYSIRLTAPNLVNIEGNDFESDGTPSGTSGITIYVPSVSASFPSVGINIVRNYFEGNTGTEIWITPQASSLSVHNVVGNIFARTLTNLSNGVVLANALGSQTNVNVGGNSFLDTTGIPGTFKWLQVTNSATFNYTFDCSQQNNTNTPAEIDSHCSGARIAGGTVKSDVNGTYIGLN